MWFDHIWGDILFPVFIVGVILFAVGALMVIYLGWPSFIATVMSCVFSVWLVKTF